MAGDIADSRAEILAFYKAAGLEQYSKKLVDEGYDLLSNLLALNEVALQELKVAVSKGRRQPQEDHGQGVAAPGERPGGARQH